MKRIASFPFLNAPFRVLSLLIIFSLTLAQTAWSQAETDNKKDTRPVRNLFESTLMIDNQTAVVPIKGTFQFDIQHRFGTWENGYDDFYGVFAPSNIRLGLNYVPINKLMLGFGFAKDNRLLDFSGKYALLQQGREGGSPIALTYLVNMAIDSRENKKSGFEETTDNFSYFHQIMVARKLTDAFSLQAAFNLSYFNYVRPHLGEENEYLGRRDNNVFSTSFLGRYKISTATGLIVNFDIPLSENDFDDLQPNISFGVEFVSSSHAFQIFIGNYKWVVPQYNHFYNLNSFDDNQILIGFNMTRLWNF